MTVPSHRPDGECDLVGRFRPAAAHEQVTALADTPAVDHLSTVSVPAGIYNTVAAQFASDQLDAGRQYQFERQILTVIGPTGARLAQATAAARSRPVAGANLGAGTYKIIACASLTAHHSLTRHTDDHRGRAAAATAAELYDRRDQLRASDRSRLPADRRRATPAPRQGRELLGERPLGI